MEDFYIFLERLGIGYSQYKTGETQSKIVNTLLDLLPFVILLIFIYLVMKK